MTVAKRGLTIGLVMAGAIGITALAACSGSKQDSSGGGGRRGNNGPATITTAQVTQGDIGVYLDAIGTVTPVYTAAITSQVNGIITAVQYKEAQRVRKGDPLVQIDPRPYQATLVQAQGLLERDENLLAQQELDLKRYRDALARNAIAQQTVDDQEKLVLQTRGTVKNDRGVVDYDQVQLDYCRITAPIDGQVGLRLVDPGNVVTAGGSTTLAVITQLEPITVVFTLPEDSLDAVQDELRNHATLSVDALDRSGQKKLAAGTLTALDNQIDTTTGTVKARATFDNKDDRLFPNQFVNTRLLVKTLRGVTLVPASAIQQNGKTSFVYVIQDSVAHMQEVKTGVTDGNVTQVEGLSSGETVANSGFEKLQDKAPVVLASGAGAGSGAGGGAASGGAGGDGAAGSAGSGGGATGMAGRGGGASAPHAGHGHGDKSSAGGATP